jgi:hypothetical protein
MQNVGSEIDLGTSIDLGTNFQLVLTITICVTLLGVTIVCAFALPTPTFVLGTSICYQQIGQGPARGNSVSCVFSIAEHPRRRENFELSTAAPLNDDFTLST